MIEPASTVPPPADPAVARGRVASIEDDSIVLGFSGTEYRITLRTPNAVNATIGETIQGIIACQATRMDVLRSGGKFVEPVEGRPRRIQGRIVAIDQRNNTVTINAGVPLNVTPHKLQKATDFEVDQLVTMSVLDGATFEMVID
jgi:hypothetical protein